MLNNAQQYNRPDSRIHRDAVTLQAAVQAAVTQIRQNSGVDDNKTGGVSGKGSGSSAKVSTPQHPVPSSGAIQTPQQPQQQQQSSAHQSSSIAQVSED